MLQPPFFEKMCFFFNLHSLKPNTDVEQKTKLKIRKKAKIRKREFVRKKKRGNQQK